MSGASARRKGNTYERAGEVYFTGELGDRYTRRNRGGFDGDDGDIDDFISIEFKNQKEMKLAGWIDQAASNAGDRVPVVVHKRRGCVDVGDHYATMKVSDLLRLLELYDRVVNLGGPKIGGA